MCRRQHIGAGSYVPPYTIYHIPSEWTEGATIHLQKGLKFPDFVQWLNYYFVLFDCFPFFLHLLTSVIKLILRLKFFYRQRQAEDMGRGRKDHTSPLHFKIV